MYSYYYVDCLDLIISLLCVFCLLLTDHNLSTFDFGRIVIFAAVVLFFSAVKFKGGAENNGSPLKMTSELL